MTSKITYFLEYFKYLENPIDCLLFKFGFKNSCTAKPKDYDENIAVNNVTLMNMVMNCLSRSNMIDMEPALEFIKKAGSEEEIIEWEEIKVLNREVFSFFENYCDNSWTKMGIDYNNRVIIDVGDTALIFAKSGATVYSFEPVRNLYEIARENVSLNRNLKDKIQIFNYGVGEKRGKVDLKDMDSISGYSNKNDSYTIDVITIEDILKDYDVKPDMLKMDCEGCEFGIIENTDLSSFNDVLFEHHAKMVDSDYRTLTEKLENEGFKIKTYDWFGLDFEDQGIIHAYK